MIKICPQCGKEFETDRENAKFCSKQCLYDSRKVNKERVCPICGKTFIYKKAKQKYCSLKCNSTAQQSLVDNSGKKKRLHNIWTDMKTRCYNANTPVFKYYGAKGIKVCDIWKNSFKSFYEWALSNGYEDDLSIDRINYEGDYEPDNCRWADLFQQANNKTNNKWVSYNGETKTIGQWEKETGLTWDIIDWRLKQGWSPEKALTLPRLKNQFVTQGGIKISEYNNTKEL